MSGAQFDPQLSNRRIEPRRSSVTPQLFGARQLDLLEPLLCGTERVKLRGRPCGATGFDEHTPVAKFGERECRSGRTEVLGAMLQSHAH